MKLTYLSQESGGNQQRLYGKGGIRALTWRWTESKEMKDEAARVTKTGSTVK